MAYYVYRGTEPIRPREIQPAHWGKSGPKPKPPKPFDPTLCGTMDGYRQHRRHDQEQCRGCLDAHVTYYAEYRAKKRIDQKRN